MFYEGDYYIPRQVDRALKEDRNLIRVVCSDTDVLVLLCTMYIVKKLDQCRRLYGRFHRRKKFDKHQENIRKVQKFNTFIVGSSCENRM